MFAGVCTVGTGEGEHFDKDWFILRKGGGSHLAGSNPGVLGVEFGIMMSTIIEKCLTHPSSPSWPCSQVSSPFTDTSRFPPRPPPNRKKSQKERKQLKTMTSLHTSAMGVRPISLSESSQSAPPTQSQCCESELLASPLPPN